MSSPFDCLHNCDMTLSRATAYAVDPQTGNEIPTKAEKLEVKVYLKTMKPAKDGNGKASQDTYEVKGWMVDPSNLPEGFGLGMVDIPCTIHEVGTGVFTFTRQIHSAQAIVEPEIGDYVQGTFKAAGAGR